MPHPNYLIIIIGEWALFGNTTNPPTLFINPIVADKACAGHHTDYRGAIDSPGLLYQSHDCHSELNSQWRGRGIGENGDGYRCFLYHI